MKTLRIALLLADTPVAKVLSTHGNYLSIYQKWLQSSIDYFGNSTQIHLDITGFDIVHNMDYPDINHITETFDCIMITGSASSAYDDILWINKLLEYIQKLKILNIPIPLIGICFGHQIIARAYNGLVKSNPKGWELGSHEIKMTEYGKDIFKKDILNIEQVHKDHVENLPMNEFNILASNSISFIQAFMSKKNAPHRILCIQGHPEFTSNIVQGIIETRKEKGILTEEFANECLIYANKNHDGIEIGQKIIEWLGF